MEQGAHRPASVAAAYWAPSAYLPQGWAHQVLLTVGPDGRWASVTASVPQPPPGAVVLPTPVLPGLVDAHSHAFQRAFAGLAEHRNQGDDDFWSWRDRMYQVALRVQPSQLRAIAAHLYAELLAGGYTHVCEFHYLHHDTDGRPYADDPLRMAWALADAATDVGIGLTLLPVVYERAGFAQASLRADQRRFRLGADEAWAFAQRVNALRRNGLDAGVAIHSLRAAAPDAIRRLQALVDSFSGPIHVHVAEQTAEVDDCLAATGARPIEWLAREGLLDARWNLVHATHTVPGEIDAVASRGATVVLCPTTEANLGDGFADVPGWLAAGVPLAIGSDSHVTRDWREELRWAEYGQRLLLRQRNVGARPGLEPSSATRWWRLALGSGAQACGQRAWGFTVGARADLLVPDPSDPALLGVDQRSWLDALVFSSPTRAWSQVMVAGRWVVRAGCHVHEARVSTAFADAMAALQASGPA